MAKESTLINVVREIGEKLNKAKQEKAGLEANKSMLQTRMKETAEELMKMLNADSLNMAFSKLATLTRLEVEFEQVMNEITECYETGEFDKFKELTDKANKVAEDMLKVKNVGVQHNQETTNNVEEDKVTEKKDIDDEDDEDIDIPKVSPSQKKEELKAEIKKQVKKVEFDDEDDEDI